MAGILPPPHQVPVGLRANIRLKGDTLPAHGTIVRNWKRKRFTSWSHTVGFSVQKLSNISPDRLNNSSLTELFLIKFLTQDYHQKSWEELLIININMGVARRPHLPMHTPETLPVMWRGSCFGHLQSQRGPAFLAHPESGRTFPYSTPASAQTSLSSFQLPVDNTKKSFQTLVDITEIA